MNQPTLPELPVWQRVRRYAVPPSMIEAVAAARAEGDWRAGCAAGRIDVDLDLAEVRRTHGARQADLIEADLNALAPDLLRWHLPRVLGGRTSLATHHDWLLSTREGRIGGDDALLVLRTPKTVDGSQRLRLEVRAAVEANPGWPDLPPVFWSAEHVAGLREAYGGTPQRMPGFEADGSVRPFTVYPTQVDPADAATRTEVFDRLLAAGDPVGAWAAAGVDLDATPPEGRRRHYLAGGLIGQALPVGLAAELTRLRERYDLDRLVIRHDTQPVAEVRHEPHGVAARLLDYDRQHYHAPVLAGPVYSRPADLELIRRGLLDPAELHPLVRGVLFPAVAAEPVRDRIDLHRDVPVRCRGEWHTLRHADGRLDPTSHPPEEVRREQLLGGLGGQVAGCLSAVAAWRGSTDHLPRPLKQLRREVLLRIQHGGTAALAALLDAGLDPRMGDGRGGTLLHHVRSLDDAALIGRLADAGVPVDARDRRKRTALHVAAGDGASPEMVRALLEAGADPTVEDENGYGAIEVAGWKVEMYEEDDEEPPGPRLILQILEEWMER
ncbi:ankyrin repeat domain-containing protein [Micromonospora sp. 15K316]|uniref:ankyrin repeat domain-containing protein n=1 Tax=Micromonospora sp. 15K316 TaxID=2530376 RepID=UPI0010483398|nr:ankyrin repeat domain-containing protein [Micromonospora sp. 15K316]TDC33221.1 ankyrin repeat domain-containing protein [Micromonospora sp. 15K316]